jgi:hypothetical protein
VSLAGLPIIIVHRKRKFHEISNDNQNMNHSVMIASSRPLADITNTAHLNHSVLLDGLEAKRQSIQAPPVEGRIIPVEDELNLV